MKIGQMSTGFHILTICGGGLVQRLESHYQNGVKSEMSRLQRNKLREIRDHENYSQKR